MIFVINAAQTCEYKKVEGVQTERVDINMSVRTVICCNYRTNIIFHLDSEKILDLLL